MEWLAELIVELVGEFLLALESGVRRRACAC